MTQGSQALPRGILFESLQSDIDNESQIISTEAGTPPPPRAASLHEPIFIFMCISFLTCTTRQVNASPFFYMPLYSTVQTSEDSNSLLFYTRVLFDIVNTNNDKVKKKKTRYSIVEYFTSFVTGRTVISGALLPPTGH